jgi:hypothetical protein
VRDGPTSIPRKYLIAPDLASRPAPSAVAANVRRVLTGPGGASRRCRRRRYVQYRRLLRLARHPPGSRAVRVAQHPRLPRQRSWPPHQRLTVSVELVGEHVSDARTAPAQRPVGGA